jgi:hypothetical protein
LIKGRDHSYNTENLTYLTVLNHFSSDLGYGYVWEVTREFHSLIKNVEPGAGGMAQGVECSYLANVKL